ncbi:Tropinesterase [Thauera sp. GDN1]|uniref:alpha/beta fold hydrolase n=1 Tax=Thauera sp. GDN1 TaxID=2944810 RepID=UPI002479CA2B|nr:alpha/beta hydrolase [Thauera sp. GDN1]WEN40650.1 Tropinesterase [Thauera sp. GDN1]
MSAQTASAPVHKPSLTEQLPVCGLSYTVRRWGPADAPALFLLHGWMDSSPTFQFVVDALRGDWQVIAPDWRGFGGSTWFGHPYWFPDYYADLEVLLDHYAPHGPVRLVGHSMGAAVAGVYAGLRPERVSHLVMMDFLGLKPPAEADSPMLLRKWLDAQATPPRLPTHADHAAFARRLRTVNPRLTPARADFLARHVGRVGADGRVEMACDPWHKVPSPFVYRIEDVMACWRQVRAPTLMLFAEHGYVNERFGDDAHALQRRLDCFVERRVVTIADAGHNLQHDQPEQVAAALEDFLRTGAA